MFIYIDDIFWIVFNGYIYFLYLNINYRIKNNVSGYIGFYFLRNYFFIEWNNCFESCGFWDDLGLWVSR